MRPIDDLNVPEGWQQITDEPLGDELLRYEYELKPGALLEVWLRGTTTAYGTTTYSLLAATREAGTVSRRNDFRVAVYSNPDRARSGAQQFIHLVTVRTRAAATASDTPVWISIEEAIDEFDGPDPEPVRRGLPARIRHTLSRYL